MNKPLTKLTKSGVKKLEAELENLKTVVRPEIAEKIKLARSFGDLSENSEYDEAKNDQARLEARISRLEERLKNVQIVDHISTDTVAVGTKVILLDMEFDDKTEYRIASSGTGGDDDNVVTADSPVGQAIMGHAVGEVVDIKTPNGQTYQMKIIEIGK